MNLVFLLLSALAAQLMNVNIMLLSASTVASTRILGMQPMWSGNTSTLTSLHGTVLGQTSMDTLKGLFRYFNGTYDPRMLKAFLDAMFNGRDGELTEVRRFPGQCLEREGREGECLVLKL